MNTASDPKGPQAVFIGGEGGIPSALPMQPSRHSHLSSQPVLEQEVEASGGSRSFPVVSGNLALEQVQDKDNPDAAEKAGIRFARPRQITAAGPTTATARDADLTASIQGPDPRLGPVACIYVRYSTKFQGSTADQVRACREHAERIGAYVPDDLVFIDEGKTGRGFNRPGFKAMHATLKSGRASIVIFFTTSRLGRKTYKVLRFVEEEIVDKGLRAIFVSNGIDTDSRDQWRQLMHLYAVQDELMVQMTAHHVLAAEVGLFRRGLVCNTVPFGYKAQEVEGLPTRRNRPRCTIVPDPETKRWVTVVFGWFTVQDLSISAIVRRLNEAGAPPSPRAKAGWTRLAVRTLLANRAYIGEWTYGRARNEFVSSKDYVKRVPREQPLATEHLENRRLIDDITFAKAQERLVNFQNRVGRRPKDGDHKSRPRVLNRFYICAEHEYPLIVTGMDGRYMACPLCQRDSEPALVSLLHRRRALDLICYQLAKVIRENTNLTVMVIKACQEAERAHQRPDVSALESLKRQAEAVTKRIKFIRATSAGSDFDEEEAGKEIVRAQAERASVQRQISELEAAIGRKVVVPDESEVRQRIDDVCYTLQHASESDSPEDLADLRRVVELLTNGRIVVTQQGEPKRQRGWPRLTFRSKVLAYLLGGYGIHGVNDDGVEIVIDVRRQPRHEEIADAVKERADAGVPTATIAKEFKAGKGTITKALQYWHTSRGLEPPDYRAMRDRLKRRPIPKYQEIAEEAARLVEQPLHIHEIAERVDANRDTTAKAINWWREQHGQPKVDFRHRRKELTQKRRQKEDGQNRDANRSQAAG